ncbi:hypothetical protein GSI_04577 [Ganoderma sinense ZZ0214-1]|uniref:F-box domain-containing protein n=1 Tax=Ganoderma sinense ZZ0214-1 TaxID=1077348 RepID=A0A2G8SHT9_9APHY|nr:hypothetical protein GSI_04577 [Ganoderma sinense ZZ0214-1]
MFPRPELTSALPEVDARELVGLSDAPDPEVWEWIRHKVEVYQNHISTLLTIHNTIVPINTLPTEILQQIFTSVPAAHGVWCDALWMLSLGSVCRLWRSILLATPEYWARGLHTVMDPDFYTSYRGGGNPVDPHDSDDSGDSDDSDDPDITEGRALFLARSAPWPLEIPFQHSSFEDGPGWDVFEGHFDRVTILQFRAMSIYELQNLFDMWTRPASMQRLERLELELVQSVHTSTDRLEQWKAEALPRLEHLKIPGDLFCCATTVPSLHTVILTGHPRSIRSIPDLLDALEKCPALTTFGVKLTNNDDPSRNRTAQRVLDIPNIRNLAVSGGMSAIHYFLCSLSFPSATLVDLNVTGTTGNEQDHGLVLSNVLPRSLSMTRTHHMLDGIDRLSFYSFSWATPEGRIASVSMRGYVQGAERLHVSPAFWFRSASHFLQILALFQECRVFELALDLRHTPKDADGVFWMDVFTALPDLRRLELLSPTMRSRKMKRDAATYYLASCRAPEPQFAPHADPVAISYRGTAARRAASLRLAWVLRAKDSSCDSSESQLWLEAQCRDIEQVLSQHVAQSGCLERLELCVTTSERRLSYTPRPHDTPRVKTDDGASRLVTGDYVSRLEAMADIVVVSGENEWGFASLSEEEDAGVRLEGLLGGTQRRRS